MKNRLQKIWKFWVSRVQRCRKRARTKNPAAPRDISSPLWPRENYEPFQNQYWNHSVTAISRVRSRRARTLREAGAQICATAPFIHSTYFTFIRLHSVSYSFIAYREGKGSVNGFVIFLCLNFWQRKIERHAFALPNQCVSRFFALSSSYFSRFLYIICIKFASLTRALRSVVFFFSFRGRVRSPRHALFSAHQKISVFIYVNVKVSSEWRAQLCAAASTGGGPFERYAM